MVEGVEIRGGADEFQAAVIAVVLDHIAREEQEARAAPPVGAAALPAWVEALRGEEWPGRPRWAGGGNAPQPRLMSSLNSGERSR